MRGLDTNVLIRYVMADDERQLAAVDRLIAQSRRMEEQFFLPLLVLCEAIWVLEASYDQPKTAILTALENILATGIFVVEQEDVARRSLELYRGGKGDFADYVIAELCKENGCRDLVSFDRSLKGSAGVTVL